MMYKNMYTIYILYCATKFIKKKKKIVFDMNYVTYDILLTHRYDNTYRGHNIFDIIMRANSINL